MPPHILILLLALLHSTCAVFIGESSAGEVGLRVEVFDTAVSLTLSGPVSGWHAVALGGNLDAADEERMEGAYSIVSLGLSDHEERMLTRGGVGAVQGTNQFERIHSTQENDTRITVFRGNRVSRSGSYAVPNTPVSVEFLVAYNTEATQGVSYHGPSRVVFTIALRDTEPPPEDEGSDFPIAIVAVAAGVGVLIVVAAVYCFVNSKKDTTAGDGMTWQELQGQESHIRV